MTFQTYDLFHLHKILLYYIIAELIEVPREIEKGSHPPRHGYHMRRSEIILLKRFVYLLDCFISSNA